MPSNVGRLPQGLFGECLAQLCKNREMQSSLSGCPFWTVLLLCRLWPPKPQGIPHEMRRIPKKNSLFLRIIYFDFDVFIVSCDEKSGSVKIMKSKCSNHIDFTQLFWRIKTHLLGEFLCWIQNDLKSICCQRFYCTNITDPGKNICFGVIRNINMFMTMIVRRKNSFYECIKNKVNKEEKTYCLLDILFQIKMIFTTF